MDSNKKKGSSFEQEMCLMLSEAGYWVHNFANRKNGQPVDIIYCKNNICEIADCKVCDNGYFVCNRLEENQEYSIRKWFKCNNGDAALFFKLPDGSVYKYLLCSVYELDELMKKKRLSEAEIRKLPRWR